MDVRLWGSQGKMPDASAPATPKPGVRSLEPEQIAAILGERRLTDLRIAEGFSECRGLSPQQVEDLYQATTLALLHRPHRDEKHLWRALHRGIKQRALNLHRDQRSRDQILAKNAAAIHALASARSDQQSPEQIALARQDRLLITEFLAELTPVERRVFWLVTEGMGYNRIAREEGMSVPEARSAVAACERKRERFQKLHDHGRLCGYRSQTIKALLDGQATSEQLAQLAVAHVQGCAQCRAEHKTNAKRLRRAFEEQAAALLPPILTGCAGRLARRSIHARVLAHRVLPDWVSAGQDGVRERAVALLAGGGVSVKLAAGIAAVAVVAGGTIGATHQLVQHPRHHHHLALTGTGSPAVVVAQPVALTRPFLPAQHARSPHAHTARRRPASPGHVAATSRALSARAGARREPGGFAYLGVPTTTTTTTTTSTPSPADTAGADGHTTGGPFSP